MATGGAFQVKVLVDAEKTSDEFKQARRDFNQRLKHALKVAAEKVVLPVAKRLAAGLKVDGVPIAGTLKVVPRSNHSYLASTLRGKKNRAAGLLEFGGTVRQPFIEAKSAGALYWPGAAHPVLQVDGGAERTVKGRHYLTGAVDKTEGRRDKVLLEELMEAFDGLEHRP